MAVDWTDPCARAAALRDAYFKLIKGDAESAIRQSTPEGDQEVRYSKADVDRLKKELDTATAECAALNGTPVPRRRFAIRAGARYQG